MSNPNFREPIEFQNLMVWPVSSCEESKDKPGLQRFNHLFVSFQDFTLRAQSFK